MIIELRDGSKVCQHNSFKSLVYIDKRRNLKISKFSSITKLIQVSEHMQHFVGIVIYFH